jgi:hypothetical protein
MIQLASIRLSLAQLQLPKRSVAVLWWAQWMHGSTLLDLLFSSLSPASSPNETGVSLASETSFYFVSPWVVSHALLLIQRIITPNIDLPQGADPISYP